METEKRYVRRGEIYDVKSADTFGSEVGYSRPGLVISDNGGNATSTTVIVAMLTTKDHNIGIHYGPFNNTGRPSFVQCEQLQTVSKLRLGRMMGSLSENQMKEVDDLLDKVLDLGWVDDTPMKNADAERAALRLQLQELQILNAALQKKVDGHTDELMLKDIEIAVQKKMYEKAVGVIAAMRAEPDMPPLPPKKREYTPKSPSEPPKPSEPESVPGLADINSASFGVLRSIGLSNSLVLQVINNRPYKSVKDLKKVPGLNSRTYALVEKKVCCIPVKVDEPKPEEPMEPVVTEESVVTEAEEPREKVNVNTATVPEMMNEAGLSKKVACEIRAYRNKHGRFESLDELLNVSSFGNGCMKKFGERLTV